MILIIRPLGHHRRLRPPRQLPQPLPGRGRRGQPPAAESMIRRFNDSFNVLLSFRPLYVSH